jgi:hypothetical protein
MFTKPQPEAEAIASPEHKDRKPFVMNVTKEPSRAPPRGSGAFGEMHGRSAAYVGEKEEKTSMHTDGHHVCWWATLSRSTAYDTQAGNMNGE